MKIKYILSSFVAAVTMLAATFSARADSTTVPHGITRIPVVFTGGYETDPRDNGRPVALVAAALGVSHDLFRRAFSRVQPADPNVGPTGDEARRNKTVLMNALGRYGVTNERLDAVSDYYRYARGRDELWRHKPAVAFAMVRNGAIIGYEVTDGGSGYCSPPIVSVPGITKVNAKVELTFGKVMERNGSVSNIRIEEARN